MRKANPPRPRRRSSSSRACTSPTAVGQRSYTPSAARPSSCARARPFAWSGLPLTDRGWADVAILPQSMGLMEELTIRENVELPTQLAPGPDRAKRVEGLLRYFGLAGLADRSPGEVSLGEQQRAAVARALVLRPLLLLADEPTGHQDEAWARSVLRGLTHAAREGTCLLMATHNPAAVRYVGRLLTIRDGETHEEDPARFAQAAQVPVHP